MVMILFKKPIYLEDNKSNLDIQCSLKWNAGYSEDVTIHLQIIFIKKMVVHIY